MTTPPPPPAPKSPPRFLWWLLGAFVAVVVLVPFWIGIERGWSTLFPELPVEGTVKPFRLVDQEGRAVAQSDLLGRVWVADFIFTHCRGPCPLMTRQMRRLQDRLPAAIALVSFSVDPDRDTPEVLRAYAAGYGAQGERWRFLTGGRERVYEILREGFHLVAKEEGPEADILHSTRFVLVDREGKIRGYYDGLDEEDWKKLIHDATRLAG